MTVKKGQILLVRGFDYTDKALIIHITNVNNDSCVYRRITSGIGMATREETNNPLVIGYATDRIEIIKDLNIDTKEFALDTYAMLKAHIADLYPEYFI